VPYALVTTGMALRIFARGALCAALAISTAGAAHAEASVLRISKGFGIHYLALYAMEKLQLVEKQAAAAGLGDVKVTYSVLDGGNVINDAMLAGSLDIASGGVPGFLTLWDKARAIPQYEVRGLSAVGAGSVWLVTRNPDIKTLADYTAKDRIAVPGIKTSFVAIVLQMAAAQAFGKQNYAKLDPLTVGLPHPDALAAMLSRRSEITSHFSSPPFSFIENDQPDFHRVVNSADVFGPMTIIMAYARRAFVDANPKLAAAFVAAVRDAATYIAANKREAARAYLSLAKVKATEDEMLRMLDDPDTHYSAVPEGVMKYAAFMNEIGTLKTPVKSWKDVFFPIIQDEAGN
jgi:NitT/TauT family transport system substrate-binding protein